MNCLGWAYPAGIFGEFGVQVNLEAIPEHFLWCGRAHCPAWGPMQLASAVATGVCT